MNGNKLVNKLISHLGLDEWDMMGYHLKKSKATFHHIDKKENGGCTSTSNGAVLMPYDHEYLHIVESKDFELFNYISGILKRINQRGYMTDDDMKAVAEMLYAFEVDHKNDRTTKGKRLIRDEFVLGRKYQK